MNDHVRIRFDAGEMYGPQVVIICNADPAAILERVGKRAAGRELDGRTWDEYPS